MIEGNAVRTSLMISIPSTVPLPLRTDQHGAIRIGTTRVLLEMVIRAFQRGETPEGIVQAFPSLKLDEVYAVITYYLQNRAEVDAYVQQVEEEGQRIREKIEASQPDMRDLRERLLKRLEEKRRQS
jgi:uncharacterized protein (DUF433 family)